MPIASMRSTPALRARVTTCAARRLAVIEVAVGVDHRGEV